MSKLMEPGVYCNHVDIAGPHGDVIDTKVFDHALRLDLVKMEATLTTKTRCMTRRITEVTEHFVHFESFKL